MVNKTVLHEASDLMHVRCVDLAHGNVEEKREEIRTYFHKTYDLYEKLFELLKDDDAFNCQPEKLRHPLIFYYGHTAAFFINKLMVAKIIPAKASINAAIESTCAVGVDEMSWDDLNSAHYDWPSASEVREYRVKVRELVDNVISTASLQLPIGWESPFWVIMMGIEHERIHIETSSVLFRQLSLDHIKPNQLWAPCPNSGPAPVNELVAVDGGKVRLGKAQESGLYGWDNEYGPHDVDVAAFKAAKYLVSNGEYMEFVADEGYRTEKYWTEEGWQWVQYRQAQAPVFWVPIGQGEYRYRAMTEERDMPWDWPVDVNYLEAKAFCNWKACKTGKNIRMPTESEHGRLRDLMTVQADQPEWDEAPGNINLEHYASSCPVNQFQQSCKPVLFDIIGNVWQWTETPIYPFPGFHVHPYYDDFTMPTFDSRHNIFAGGSWVSTGNEAARHARYAFRRHFFQHAGLRYIEANGPPELPKNAEPYETDSQICQSINSQFGNPKQLHGMPLANYHDEIVKVCLSHKPQEEKHTSRALEIGCEGGYRSFKLGGGFDEVVGVDTTTRLIKAGHDLQAGKTYRYVTVDEGELVEYHELSQDTQPWDKDAMKRVSLVQCNPCNLLPRLTGFDLVLLSNMTRLYDPSALLSTLHERLTSNGVLIIATAYDWDQGYTPVEKWLGGRKVYGESLRSFDALSQLLSAHFVLVKQPFDLVRVTEESSRNCKLSTVQCSVWKKI